jgi:hypothetical protein
VRIRGQDRTRAGTTRIAGQHGARDVPGDAHDHVVACATLRQLCDQRVTVVEPPSDHFRFVANLGPRRP